jgi:carbamoyltransferase
LSVQIIETSAYGIFKRVISFFKDQEKILVASIDGYPAYSGSIDRSYQRFRFSAFYLHFILNGMAIRILGISAFYHDSAAALIVDGHIIAAAQEERFTRIKHDPSFPVNAIRYVLEEGGIGYGDLSAIAFYDKPLLKFERLLETYHHFVPRGLRSFMKAMPVWIREKLFIKRLLRKHCMQSGGSAGIPLLFPEHHLSHAASAYYPSPFEEAAILTIDGVGEWATTTICQGRPKGITILKEGRFPHSVGLLYSAFTYYLGFTVNSGEYKMMGLAPYGDSGSLQTGLFRKKILDTLIDLREDGSFLLNMDYFDFATGLKMTNNKKWEALFGLPPRTPESGISQKHMDLAKAAQDITDSIVLSLACTARKLTGSGNLVMAGGVALNCVTNGKLARAGIFDNIWIQPAAGDAGGALGAAYAAYHIGYGPEKKMDPSGMDSMNGACLGPAFSDTDIIRSVKRYEAVYDYFDNFSALTALVSQLLADGRVVGWFQGRMEFGPRTLGNRSILGDPRNGEMQKRINGKIKYRESFRPFAPSLLLEDLSLFFDNASPSPYMLFVEYLKESLRKPGPENCVTPDLYERLYHLRSDIPAVTHVDYSARIQTVSKESNPRFRQLIDDFKKNTGCGMLINTSFNVRGEPIVCTPQDAYLGFMRTEMDWLVMGNCLFDREKQKKGLLDDLPKINFAPD